MILDPIKVDLFLAGKCMCRTDLSRAAKVSTGTISEALRGKDIKPRTFGRLAAALGVHPIQILKGEGGINDE